MSSNGESTSSAMATATATTTTATAPKPKPKRPESTMAINFSEVLESVFNLGGGLPELSQTIDQKKYFISDSSQRELQELEARLKAAEERLTKAGVAPTSYKQSEQRDETSTAAPAAPSRGAPPVPGQTSSQRPQQRPQHQYEDEDDDDEEDDEE